MPTSGMPRRHTIDSCQSRCPDDSLHPALAEDVAYKVHKHHRRASSTGGGRAWTEDEEEYLLRTRQHKMPYKHIAAHLKKTELACRLHYHQMAYGSNNRRNRHHSVSSTASSRSLLGPRDYSPERTTHSSLSPVPSPPSSPEHSPSKPTSSPSFVNRSHVPILPKPGTSEIVPSSHSHAGHGLFKPTSQLDSRFDRSITQPVPTTPTQVNIEKLCKVYEANRTAFWSAIAAEYSADSRVTGAQLEEVFWLSCVSAPRPHGNGSPPMPPSIPRDTPSYYAQGASCNGPKIQQEDSANVQRRNAPSSTGIVTSSNRTSRISSGVCSVSALLTEEKEIRPFRECM